MDLTFPTTRHVAQISMTALGTQNSLFSLTTNKWRHTQLEKGIEDGVMLQKYNCYNEYN